MTRKRFYVTFLMFFCLLILSCGNNKVAGAKKKNTTCSYKVSVRNCKNGSKKIYGKIYRPDKKGKVPLLIYAHGLGGNHEGGLGYAKHFAGKGIAVYLFDFCGGGNLSKSDGDTTQMSVMTEVSDLETVLETARKWTFVDKNKITLLGASQGGMVSAIVAAKKSKKVRGLMLLYPGFVIPDYVHKLCISKEMIPKTYNVFGIITVGNIYASDVWDYDVYKEIKKYKKKVLIIHGDADLIVPLSYSKKAKKVYKQAELKVISGSGHGFYEDADRKAKKYMDQYMRQQKNG